MKRIQKMLGYLGLIPFLVLAELVVIDWGPARDALLSYSVLILSFLSGTIWKASLSEGDDRDVWGAVVSNLFMLCAWGAIVLNHPVFSVLFVAVLFVLLLIFELSRYGKRYDVGYIRLRKTLTAVVAVSLLVAAVFGS